VDVTRIALGPDEARARAARPIAVEALETDEFSARWTRRKEEVRPTRGGFERPADAAVVQRGVL